MIESNCLGLSIRALKHVLILKICMKIDLPYKGGVWMQVSYEF